VRGRGDGEGLSFLWGTSNAPRQRSIRQFDPASLIDDGVDDAGFMQIACIIDIRREHQAQRPGIAVCQIVADAGQTRRPT
jgi:hypothetical protein